MLAQSHSGQYQPNHNRTNPVCLQASMASGSSASVRTLINHPHQHWPTAGWKSAPGLVRPIRRSGFVVKVCGQIALDTICSLAGRFEDSPELGISPEQQPPPWPASATECPTCLILRIRQPPSVAKASAVALKGLVLSGRSKEPRPVEMKWDSPLWGRSAVDSIRHFISNYTTTPPHPNMQRKSY